MSTSRETFQEIIPESSAAKTAYHLAVIPILGFFLFIGLSFLAFYQISKGMDGLSWLRKGFWRMLRMTTIGIVGFAVGWFCPYWDKDHLDWYDEYAGQGYFVRSPNYPARPLKMWHWVYFYKYDNKRVEGDYWFGNKHGPWVSLYENGNKCEEGWYKNNNKEGRWTTWHRNGQKESEGEYKDGTAEGTWIKFYENGQEKEMHELKNGKYNGTCIWFYMNGIKQSQQTFENGKSVGKWFSWHNNGQKESEGELIASAQTQKVTKWDKQGNIIEERCRNISSPDEIKVITYINGIPSKPQFTRRLSSGCSKWSNN